MKKRILALLLAGLLTASLASCFNNSNNGDDTSGNGTEPSQTTPSIEDTTTPPEPITFKEVDETVYTVVDKAKLLVDPESTTGAVQVNKLTEMRRVKVSTVWSVVEYMDEQYYVASASLTNADLMGKGFTACSPEKTMYVKTETLNVRTYASSEKYSDVVDHLQRNDTVTVVAEGKEWSKIKVTGEGNAVSYYFVFSEYLSATEYVDPNSIDFSSYFTACNPEKTMYATGSVRVRKNAHAESDELDVLVKDDQVTVVALGQIGESTWAKVKIVEAPDKEGDPENIYFAYVNAKYLSDIKGGEVTVTLDDILAEYPDYTKLENALTMYANGICWVRSSPEIISQTKEDGSANPDFNGVGNLAKAQQIKVVASGDVWAIIQYGEDDALGFVHMSMLTTDDKGEPVHLSLAELLKLYPNFSAITELTVYATGKVNCYTEPKVGETAAKSLEAGTQVTKVAISELDNWCIIRTADGAYYFVGSNLFTETQPAA
ncbi:MAG: SH3 domain-containing protein [Clostridia bacterium]|nr:SH3 domain-containing protein [Clostridia bacterium]